MESLIVFVAALVVLFYILKYDATWLQYRIELLTAMLGYNYKPSKNVCFALAVFIFYLIYGVIFER